MKKKDKKNIIDEMIKLKNEMLIEEVNEIFRDNPENYREELARLGFQWVDDGYPEEIEEEENATVENGDQRMLVSYFNGDIELSDKILDAFIKEKSKDEPNYPLLRRYFRQGNKRLKALIYRGLEIDPTDKGFLNDLSFFHEFQPMLGELIERYTDACRLQEDMNEFSELVRDFYYNTAPDGYEAYEALKEIYGLDTSKGQIIDFLGQTERELEEAISHSL
jgi:hypothetical protein